MFVPVVHVREPVAIVSPAESTTVYAWLPAVNQAAAQQPVASVVHDGGRIVYWVYGLENNEWITRVVDPVRKALTSKVPYGPLKALSAIPAAAIWGAIKLFYAPGPDGKWPSHLPYGQYFSNRSNGIR